MQSWSFKRCRTVLADYLESIGLEEIAEEVRETTYSNEMTLDLADVGDSVDKIELVMVIEEDVERCGFRNVTGIGEIIAESSGVVEAYSGICRLLGVEPDFASC